MLSVSAYGSDKKEIARQGEAQILSRISSYGVNELSLPPLGLKPFAQVAANKRFFLVVDPAAYSFSG